MRLTFETPRLAMRPFEPGDARRIAYLAGEYDVAKMCSRVPHPYSVSMAERWLAGHDTERGDKRDFPFAVTHPRDGVIGSCGTVHPELREGCTPTAWHRATGWPSVTPRGSTGCWRSGAR